MKIVINDCHGGFGLSDDAIDAYLVKKGLVYYKMPSMHTLDSAAYYKVPFHVYEAQHKIDKKTGIWKSNEMWWSPNEEIERNDPVLISIVETMGDGANGRWAKLKIVEIPDDVDWQIDEYDGEEWIAEKHRVWS